MKYRKRPVIIEAVQWNGNNIEIIHNFMSVKKVIHFGNDNQIGINTLEGLMAANIGDYIIKDVNGEFYPCKDSIFKLTYEKVE